ncbi:restriction endonuclease [Bacteroidetes/Chlorobi group bacterium ChocPot_Mid]|nr:MAG: restriction endonuclease [Bacteroidetes/Chlorobi group bacterium ChocPot_Mid]
MLTTIEITKIKQNFRTKLSQFVQTLKTQVSTESNEWTIKGFIDIFKNIYTISADTKIISKILEIHILPKLLQFASDNNYKIILADHQNYYPDLSFVEIENENIKFAIDLKTTYRKPENPEFCNGFTLGSHGEYFVNRTSKKNIQFPYNDYLGHFCLGIIYSRTTSNTISELSIHPVSKLKSIVSVINDFEFFVCEKWELASDRSGSGNTANIGSITKIEDIILGNGLFKKLGEHIFDDYWMNYGKITIRDKTGKEIKIRNLHDFLLYRGIDTNKINKKGRQ